MGSITTLGKRNHKLLRDELYYYLWDNGDYLSNEEGRITLSPDPNATETNGGWVDGEWVEATKREVTIRANIQPSFGSPLLKILPESEREKESILIFSNDWVYTARSGRVALQADIILYRGAEWEVQVSRPFGNFGEHCEAIAIKLKDSVIPRNEGKVGRID